MSDPVKAGALEGELRASAAAKAAPPAPAAGDGGPPSEEAAAGWLSRLTFSWVGSLLRNGRRRTLRMCDLWELSPGDEAGPLCDEFERRWATATAAAAAATATSTAATASKATAGDAEASAPSVGGILYSMFARPFWASAALYMGVVVAQFSCAALVREMVSWVLRYGVAGGDATAAEGWLICLGLLLLQLLQCVCQSHTDFIMMRGGLRARALLVAITFRRSLGLTVRARVSSHADTGRLVNLMASDSQVLTVLTD